MVRHQDHLSKGAVALFLFDCRELGLVKESSGDVDVRGGIWNLYASLDHRLLAYDTRCDRTRGRTLMQDQHLLVLRILFLLLFLHPLTFETRRVNLKPKLWVRRVVESKCVVIRFLAFHGGGEASR